MSKQNGLICTRSVKEDVSKSKQASLKRSLDKYYADVDNRRQLTRVVARKSEVSLRTIDWLTTNYAKKHNIVYVVEGTGRNFNVFLEYKACLRSFSKKYFDPFCRRERVPFEDGYGGDIKSTIAQQNFFMWAIKNGVVDYAETHFREIDADMNSALQHRCKQRTLKRKELSKAAVRSCTKTNISVTVKFT